MVSSIFYSHVTHLGYLFTNIIIIISCQNTPTQHRLSSVTDGQMPENRSIERNKKNEGQHSGENKRKMAREEDAWTIAT